MVYVIVCVHRHPNHRLVPKLEFSRCMYKRGGCFLILFKQLMQKCSYIGELDASLKILLDYNRYGREFISLCELVNIHIQSQIYSEYFRPWSSLIVLVVLKYMDGMHDMFLLPHIVTDQSVLLACSVRPYIGIQFPGNTAFSLYESAYMHVCRCMHIYNYVHVPACGDTF